MTSIDTPDTPPTALASGVPQIPIPYRLIPAQDLPGIVDRFIDLGCPVSLDVETTTTNPWASKLISVQVGDERGGYVVDMRHATTEDWASLRMAARLLFSGRVEIAGHNIKFDTLVLCVHLGIGPDELRALRLYDSMLAEQVIVGGADEADGSGTRAKARLDVTAARYGVSVSKDPREWFVNLDAPDRQAEWDAPLPDAQLAYAALDVVVLPAVRAGQASEIVARGLADTVALEMACTPAVIAMELAGIAVDVDGWRAYLAGVKAQADGLEARVQTDLAPAFLAARRAKQVHETALLVRWQNAKEAEIVGARARWDALPKDTRPLWGEVRKWAIRQFTDARPRPKTPAPLPPCVNLSSPQQKKEALAYQGVALLDTEAETLEAEAKRRPDVPALGMLVQWSKLNKLLSSFGETVLERVQGDGADGTGWRLHPGWRQIGSEEGGVSTGRMSCGGPNFQQLPRDSADEGADSIRKHIVARPGHCLLPCDYSQMEMRILAERAQDVVLLDAFARGADVYTTMAIQMGLAPAGTTKAEAKALRLGNNNLRDAMKTVTLAVSYGMGPRSLSADLGCTEDEARAHLDAFFGAFRGVARYREQTASSALVLGYSTTVSGRRRVFRVLPKPERYQFTTRDGFIAALEAHHKTESTIRRQAVNATIQGSGADIVKLAVILAFRRLPLGAPGAHLVSCIHDELIVESPLACADEAARVLEDAMRDAARSYLPTVAIGELKAEPSLYWKKS